MIKKHNIFMISRLYVRNFYKFVIENTNITDTEEAYGLFMYCMKKLYNLDTIEFNNSIEYYSERCIEYLGSLPNTPINKDRIPYEDRVRTISICGAYIVATDILSNNFLVTGRLENE